MNGTDWNGKGSEIRGEQEPDEFEAALGRALQRVDAPAGFAARMAVMAEAESRSEGIRRNEQRSLTRWWQLSGWGWKPAWGGTAALLVAAVLAGHVVHDRHLEAEAKAQASRQFDVSLQITDRAMEHAREQLQKAGVTLDGEQ